MNTGLSYRGYSVIKNEIEADQLESIKKELTVTPYVPEGFGAPPPTFKLYLESQSKIYLPKAYGLKTFNKPVSNKMLDIATIDVKFNGSLRPEQKEPVNKFLEACADPCRRGGIITVPCAFGKTAMAIHLMCELKVKTLVVVHKEFLLQQWKERLEFFAPTARIGLIKAQKIDVQDKDVVIGSLQSLAMKKYDDAVFKDFGFTIIDECHHTSAEVFSRALQKISFMYTLGLSATPKRKDGLSKVFMWYLGETVYSITKRTDNLQVKVKEYYDRNPEYSKEWIMYNNKPNMPKMINNICDFEPRMTFILDMVKDILAIETNRKILILSDRRGHIETIITRLVGLGFDAGIYYGGMKADDLKLSEAKQIIGGTFGYSSEGLDIKGLNTLILASPKSDVVQVVGRILRDKPEEREYVPLVIDIVDNFGMFVGQAKKRLAYYKKCKYEVEDNDGVLSSAEKKKNTTVEIPKNVCLL